MLVSRRLVLEFSIFCLITAWSWHPASNAALLGLAAGPAAAQSDLCFSQLQVRGFPREDACRSRTLKRAMLRCAPAALAAAGTSFPHRRRWPAADLRLCPLLCALRRCWERTTATTRRRRRRCCRRLAPSLPARSLPGSTPTRRSAGSSTRVRVPAVSRVQCVFDLLVSPLASASCGRCQQAGAGLPVVGAAPQALPQRLRVAAQLPASSLLVGPSARHPAEARMGPPTCTPARQAWCKLKLAAGSPAMGARVLQPAQIHAR